MLLLNHGLTLGFLTSALLWTASATPAGTGDQSNSPRLTSYLHDKRDKHKDSHKHKSHKHKSHKHKSQEPEPKVSPMADPKVSPMDGTWRLPADFPAQGIRCQGVESGKSFTLDLGVNFIETHGETMANETDWYYAGDQLRNADLLSCVPEVRKSPRKVFVYPIILFKDAKKEFDDTIAEKEKRYLGLLELYGFDKTGDGVPEISCKYEFTMSTWQNPQEGKPILCQPQGVKWTSTVGEVWPRVKAFPTSETTVTCSKSDSSSNSSSFSFKLSQLLKQKLPEDRRVPDWLPLGSPERSSLEDVKKSSCAGKDPNKYDLYQLAFEVAKDSVAPGQAAAKFFIVATGTLQSFKKVQPDDAVCDIGYAIGSESPVYCTWQTS